MKWSAMATISRTNLLYKGSLATFFLILPSNDANSKWKTSWTIIILSQVDTHLFDHALTDIVASDSAVPSALPNGEHFTFQSDESVEAAKTNSIPKNTSRNTNWAVKVWKDWRNHRRTAFHIYIFHSFIIYF